MTSKLRSDFIKASALALAAAFAYTDTAILLQNTEQAVKALTTTKPIVEPANKNTSPLPLIRTFAEVVAGTRDEIDRVREIRDALSMDRTTIRGSNRVAPTPA